jgi:uncharacterized protein (TIGR02217 family)
MAFHEVQFPTAIDYGFRGGPGFSTSIVVTDSGVEERVARWETARRRYNASRALTPAQAYEVLEFYIARQGPASGFRFKDWTDYASTATGTTHNSGDAAVTDEDVEIGTGDGTETAFQLIKKYTSGPTIRSRNITKPVDGTTVIAIDTVSQASGWTVNTTTGVVTFTTAPSTGESITAGFEFDVPVRFGEEVDEEGLAAAIEAYAHETVPNIPMVEIRDTGEHHEEFYPGGAKNHGAITADVNITIGEGKIHRVEPATGSTGLAVILPVADTLPGGGPYFLIDNQGAESVTVDSSTGTTAITLTAGTQGELWISIDSGGNREWVAYG